MQASERMIRGYSFSEGPLIVLISVLESSGKLPTQFLLAGHLPEHHVSDQIECLHNAGVGDAVVNADAFFARDHNIRRAHDGEMLRKVGHANTRRLGQVAYRTFSPLVQ